MANTKKLKIIVHPVFIPECPTCSAEMMKVPGQKDGAWRCKNRRCVHRGGEFWDALDKKDFKRPAHLEPAAIPATPGTTPKSDPAAAGPPPDYLLYCPRCGAVPSNCPAGPKSDQVAMVMAPDGSWCCPECFGQYYPEGVPELSEIIDQRLRVSTRDVMRPGEGFKMKMAAKHKGHGGGNTGRTRSKAVKGTGMEDCRYGSIMRENYGRSGRKGRM